MPKQLVTVKSNKDVTLGKLLFQICLVKKIVLTKLKSTVLYKFNNSVIRESVISYTVYIEYNGKYKQMLKAVVLVI